MTERRVLTAVRFVDRATGETVTDTLRVESEGGRWYPNRQGLWVLEASPGFDDYVARFSAPPAAPAPGSVTITVSVRDPRGHWLPRTFPLALPRATADLFTPLEVTLPPAPAAPVRPNWAVVRVHAQLAEAGTAVGEGTPVEGALLVATIGSRHILSLSDARGEGQIPIPGLKLFRASGANTAVLESTTNVDVRVVVDRAATDLDTGRRTRLPDPDDLFARRTSLPSATRRISLGVGGQSFVPFNLPRS